jgi:hypothetical protein
MKKAIAIGAMLTIGAIPIAHAANENLIATWHDLNSLCRGGQPDEKGNLDAICEARDKLHNRLEAKGMCYGKKGEYGYQYHWHRCGRNSLRGDDDLQQRIEAAKKAYKEFESECFTDKNGVRCYQPRR